MGQLTEVRSRKSVPGQERRRRSLLGDSQLRRNWYRIDSRGGYMRDWGRRTSRSRYNIIRSINSRGQSRCLRWSLLESSLSRRRVHRRLWFLSLSFESVHNGSLRMVLCSKILRYRLYRNVRLSRARCSIDSSNRPRIRLELGVVLPSSQINLLQHLGAARRQMEGGSSISDVILVVVVVFVVGVPSSRA